MPADARKYGCGTFSYPLERRYFATRIAGESSAGMFVDVVVERL